MTKYLKRSINIVFYALASLFLVSCATTQQLIIEIPQPAKQSIPERIQSMTLISRAVDDSYTNSEADSLQRTFYKHRFNYDTIINDFQAVDTTLKAMGNLLFETGRFDYVIPEKRFLKAKKNAFITREMPWNEVKNLCETFNTDALISIDHFKTRVETNYSKESGFNPLEVSFYSVAVAKMYVYYETLIRIYDPLEEKIIMRKLLQDTLFWEDYDSSVSELFNRFTPVKNALLEAGIAIALDFTDEIGPMWRQETRQFYAKGNASLRQAAPLARNGQWNTAVSIWKKILEEPGSKSVKARTEYNLALACELTGNIDEAIQWATKSYNTMFSVITYQYLETLKRRKNEIKNQKL
ncbi:MAG: hypothetical protein CSA36_01675 [Draconibacterium sp.]|nr:MAG: hypothetical protein CSA36_01675 [Draconibacterium sp.]